MTLQLFVLSEHFHAPNPKSFGKETGAGAVGALHARPAPTARALGPHTHPPRIYMRLSCVRVAVYISPL